MRFTIQLALSGIFIMSTLGAADNDNRGNCIDCHQDAVQSYQRSQMARAASTPDFMREWQQNGRAEKCLDCHSPSRTQGIMCQDCHAQDLHTVKSVIDETLCAQCHHASGENTFRTYIHSPAGKQGISCVSCHLNFEQTGHEFIGPSTAGFLQGVASLRLSIRKQQDELSAIVQIRHTAGHALPGGTTGRSVWVVFESYDEDCRVIASSYARFGWMQSIKPHMIDNSLAPGKTALLEFPVSALEKVAAIRVRMLYRFVPGALNNEDDKQVLLDEKRYQLRPGVYTCDSLYTQ